MDGSQLREHIISVLEEYMNVKAKLLYFAMFFIEGQKDFHLDPVEYQALSGADSEQELDYLLYELSKDYDLIEVCKDEGEFGKPFIKFRNA